MRKLGVRVVGLLALTAFPALAQAADDNGNRAAARELGVQGVMLADKGKCSEAIEKLERAEKLFHAPTTLERLGECKVEVGRIVDGAEDLQRVVREDLPAGAPAAFTAAKTRAQGILKKALPRIAHLKLHVAAPPDTKATVLMDGNVYPDALLDGDRPVDPGTHALAATADGMIKSETSVTLGEGDSKSAELKLVPDPNAPKPVQVAPPIADNDNKNPDDGTKTQHDEPPPKVDTSSPSKVPAILAFGVGVAGIGVGTVTGILALSKKSSLDDVCQNKQCPGTSQSDIDSANTMATISTVGFIVGGVGIVGGIVLLITESGSSSSASATVGSSLAEPKKKSAAGKIQVTPDFGAGWIGAHGSF
ncbi:MAG TPA: hypothetical protein VF407_20155 [Polyangiaceae bacterium]